jgi:hypothetical protein
MATPFPELKPTRRAFKLGAFPVKVYRSLSGATVRRAFGNRATGYELQLDYQNVDDATTAALLGHYTDTSGGFEGFTVPDVIFAGMNTTVKGYIQAPAGVQWQYAEPPGVQAVYKGLSNVNVRLIGELSS